MPTIKQRALGAGIGVLELSADRYVLDRDFGCDVHGTRCGSKLRHVHHNPPLSWYRGQPFDGVEYHLCPNAHLGEAHVGLDETIGNGKLVRAYSPRIRLIIKEAFIIATKQGLTPVRTL